MTFSKAFAAEPPGEAASYPLGVVIPTFNRSQVLLLCLQHLERQTWKDFEVVVVDDGSRDDTQDVVTEFARGSQLRLRYIRQENAGPARARNKGIATLRSQVCVMIGDDILVCPSFLDTHLKFHQLNPKRHAAGLGFTCWSASGQTVTRFMKWLDESGVQFSYGDLMRGTSPSWKHFYTSNLSLKTEFLLENPFDESFTAAAVEDIELAYRLEHTCGLEMTFLPTATAEHIHPTTFGQACRRMFAVGRSTRRFHHLWPASGQTSSRHSVFFRISRALLLKNQWLLSLLTWTAGSLAPYWCPNPLMWPVLRAHFVLGYRSAAPLSS